MTCLALAGCADTVSTPVTETASILTGPAPERNVTPMEAALSCMRGVRRNDVRIGVSDFSDGTGAFEGAAQNARVVSQRADMMMVVALSRGGAQLVNRNATAVSEWEMNKAIEKKLGDGKPVQMGDQSVDFRPIKVGALLGSTHYVTGSITEVNWNIEGGVIEGGGYSAAVGARTYRISIAIDVVVTNTLTTEVVHARSYKKQLVGIETTANFFRFFTQSAAVAAIAAGSTSAATAARAVELFNANLSHKKNEPVQGALRWLVEVAAFDILRSLREPGTSCDHLLPPGTIEGNAEVVVSAADNDPEEFAKDAPLPPEKEGHADRGTVLPGWVAVVERERSPLGAWMADLVPTQTGQREPRE